MARNQLAKLYKQLLTESHKFTDYNFRSHAMRRVQHLYGKNLEETNEEKLQQLIKQAEHDFKQIQRQVTIGQLYKVEHHILDQNEEYR